MSSKKRFRRSSWVSRLTTDGRIEVFGYLKSETRRASPAGFAFAESRPRLLVRVNAIATGLIDDDLAAVVPARPELDAFVKSETVRWAKVIRNAGLAGTQ
jgi:hypothetical protein